MLIVVPQRVVFGRFPRREPVHEVTSFWLQGLRERGIDTLGGFAEWLGCGAEQVHPDLDDGACKLRLLSPVLHDTQLNKNKEITPLIHCPST